MRGKRKKITYGICFILTAVLTISNSVIPVNATIQDEKKNLQDLQNNKQNVQQIINNLEKDKSDIQTYINKLDAEVSTISEELYQTELDLSDVGKKIEKNEVKLKDAKESIGVQYSDMKLRIKNIYENGDSQMLDLILNSKSIGDFLNKAEYISEISTYDRKMLDKLKETKNTIETTQKTLNEQKGRLVDLKEEQKKKKSDVETLVAAKQNEMSQYISKISDNKNELDKLNAKIGDQQSVINEMEKIEAQRREEQKREEERRRQQQIKNANANNTPKTKPDKTVNDGSNNKPSSDNNGDKGNNNNNSGGGSASGFTWPLPGYKSLSSEFGWRADPFTGEKTFHKGIDIPAPSGTTIVAAASGEVVWSNLNPTAGNWIGIDHGNGVYTVYMHMSARLVSVGQHVSKGQAIGLVGTTGSSQGNHLHFSVRVNGTDVNPHDYVG